VVLGQATAVRDRARRQLRVTAPVAGFAPFADLRPGAPATDLGAGVWLTPSVPGTPSSVVTAPGVLVDSTEHSTNDGAAYQLGSQSCVPVGR
jgi:hypothetical protein